MKFSIGALFGWGIAIYAVIFLMWSAFFAYDFVEGWAPRLIGFAVLVVAAVVAGRSLRASSWHDILPYSIVWSVVMMLLDIVLNVPFTGWQLFANGSIWFGYAVVVFAPLLALYPRFRRFPSSIPSV